MTLSDSQITELLASITTLSDGQIIGTPSTTHVASHDLASRRRDFEISCRNLRNEALHRVLSSLDQARVPLQARRWKNEILYDTHLIILIKAARESLALLSNCPAGDEADKATALLETTGEIVQLMRGQLGKIRTALAAARKASRGTWAAIEADLAAAEPDLWDDGDITRAFQAAFDIDNDGSLHSITFYDAMSRPYLACLHRAA